MTATVPTYFVPKCQVPQPRRPDKGDHHTATMNRSGTQE